MSRPIRIEFPNAVYHLTARGNERKTVFRDDRDHRTFLRTLAECVERFGFVIHAYCLMPNHYHLVAQTPRGNLCRGAGWLQTTYSIRFNQRHARCGHVFQGRYKAHLVEADAYSVDLVRYIHMNPVRPRNAQAPIPRDRREALAAYPWSSHRAYAGTEKAPGWLSLDWLGYWGRSRRQAIKEYVRDMGARFGQSLFNPFEDLSGGLVLGRQYLREYVQTIVKASRGQEEIRWAERVEASQRTRRVKDLANRVEDRRVQVWARIKLGGERMADLAREFGYRDASGITRIVQRLEQRSGADKTLKKVMSELRSRAEVSNVKS